MPQYTPPKRDIQFVLHELLQIKDAYQEIPPYEDVDTETVDQIIDESGRFCSEVLLPLNQVGDEQGCSRSQDGTVTTPEGFKEAFAQHVAAGWPALSCSPDYGGQGLPELLNDVLQEMRNACNQAWTMYPALSHGAYAALLAHGTDAQKNTYLPKLVAGDWTGTMCLTEAQCGTDLGLLRTKAQPNDDGSYAISGSKMFISSGEHDMSDNIVHLVLARLPDAPAGTKGISMFIVPKFVPDADGNAGDRNAVHCGALEEKMGIHGNATCVINLDSAQGWLVGEPNRGLQAMFVMMNGARLGVGIQSLGVGEIAYQNALAYAKERLQMRATPRTNDKAADPIIAHPDVRRMLLTQKAYTEGGRALAYWCGLMIDQAKHHPDEKTRQDCDDLVALLTPVIKAFVTDNTFEATNLGMQVFGGHGYIQEWGMEQFARDARINLIYEGTNGIQALDLLGRKILGDSGAKLKKLGDHIQAFIQANSNDPAMQEFIEPLANVAGKVQKLTTEIGGSAMTDSNEAGAAATPYLRVVGHLLYAYMWAQMARIALAHQEEEAFYKAKLATARFYFARLLPETAYQIRAARSGADSLMDMQEDWF